MQRTPHPTTGGGAHAALLRGGLAAALALAALAAWTALASPPAQAQQSLTVTTTADDDTASDCDPGDPNDCSLREAVMNANADPSQSATITLDADTYVLDIAGTSGDASDGDLVVTSEVTIQGAGVDDTTIDASGLGHRVIRVIRDTDAVADLTLEDVTITGGDLTGPDAPAARGGGVYAGSFAGQPVSVTVLRSRVESNTALRGGGIALDNVEGDVDATISRSAITDNEATAGGGGLYAAGTGTRGEFTAIATATVEQSVIDNNEVVEGSGGGVLNEGGEVELTNTTVSNNSALFGGGISNANGPNEGPTGLLDLTHVTVARNTGEALAAPGAGGIANPAESATARATIVAENTAPNCTGGAFDSLGQNLEDADTCGFGDSTDAPDTAPDLGPLAQNAPEDPPTRTHAPAGDSPAIDYYADDGCDVAEDQREVTRPQDGDVDGTAECDIGAFELQGEAPEADVEIMKSATATALVSEQFDYELTVTNNGPDTAEDVEVTDTLPPEVGFDSVSATPGTCSGPPPDGTVECTLGDLASGDSATITITVTAETATSSATNTGEVTTTTDDPDPDNNDDSADTRISEDDFQCVPDNTADPLPEGVSRLSGPERIATAIQISQESCPDGAAGAVVLTRADIFPDALSGTPLATQEDAPILFSNTDQLHPGSQAELQRVLPGGGTVYLLGQTAALSEQVEDQVSDLGYNTIRIGGANRFGTAAEIADQGLGNPDTLLIADGANFPDAISGASGEAVNGAVLLSAGDVMPGETQAYLDGRTDDPALFAIGGPASDAAPAGATAVVGATRFHTSVEVAEQFFGSPSAVGIATGGEFADALAGGALMGKLGGPMLLTAEDDLPTVVEDYLEANAASIDRAIIFGGTAVVDSSVESAIDAAITP